MHDDKGTNIVDYESLHETTTIWVPLTLEGVFYLTKIYF